MLDAGGEHDDGRVRQGRVAAHHAGQVPAVAVWQHQIQHHQVGALTSQCVQRRLAIVGDKHLVAGLLQAGAQQSHDLLVIVYYEDALGHPLHSPQLHHSLLHRSDYTIGYLKGQQ